MEIVSGWDPDRAALRLSCRSLYGALADGKCGNQRAGRKDFGNSSISKSSDFSCCGVFDTFNGVSLQSAGMQYGGKGITC